MTNEPAIETKEPGIFSAGVLNAKRLSSVPVAQQAMASKAAVLKSLIIILLPIV